MINIAENTTYESLADALFNKIKDYSFLSMDRETAYEIVETYIAPAAAKFQSCTQDLDDRDDEFAEFNFALTKTNFEILVNYMVIEWLTSNYILTSQTLKARMSNSDFRALGLKDMLAKVTELRSSLLSENDQLAINKSYKGSPLYDLVTNRGKLPEPSHKGKHHHGRRRPDEHRVNA